jgi:hypothetical protein
MITIFQNIYSKTPVSITVDRALERIQKGRSKVMVQEIRSTLDKEKASKLKMNLPSVCFSGTFGADRKDVDLIQHSGFIVLDFDDVDDIRNQQTEIISKDFIYACWISPSGKGLKALIKIADGKKHREHFAALKDIFPEVDKSGINPSRVCFESYDPDIYIYPDSSVFTTVKIQERFEVKESVKDDFNVFENILTWLSNKGDAFVTGERNSFIFKLAGACCRFGVDENNAQVLINNRFLASSEFTKSEADKAIKSAYRTNQQKFASAVFDRSEMVDRVTRKEVKIDSAIYDESIKPKDVIYGIDVKENALTIYDNGYASVSGVGIPELDHHFKMKRGEITLLTGIGNYGKSHLKKWYQVMRILRYGEKFATFSPEDNPPEEYYHDFVEILLGCDCTPANPDRPSKATYEKAYDFISKHVFYVYPKDLSPTPEYIKERFLELIIKEKVDGVDIDPFNQLSNDYGKIGRTDLYLETFLSDCTRFAQTNNVYFLIIAHPNKLLKTADGNYGCPDVFDVAGGAMWNNKMDNILVYHRPLAQTEPQNAMCEFHSKKIRRQKTVGKKGSIIFEMVFKHRRFYFNQIDYMRNLIYNNNLSFFPREDRLPDVLEEAPF